MNLRKTRYSFRQDRDSWDDSWSPVKKIRKSSKCTKKTKYLSNTIPKTPIEYKKSVLDDFLMMNESNINIITSTPISHKVRKGAFRSSSKYDSGEISKLNSLNRLSCHNTSTPIQKTLMLIKPCKVNLERLQFMESSNGSKSYQMLRNNKTSFNSKLSHYSQNSPVQALRRSVRSARNSMKLQNENISRKKRHDINMSQKSKYGRTIFITPEKQFSNSHKLIENEVQSKNKKKCIRKSSTYAAKLVFPICSPSTDISVSDKSNEILMRKRYLKEVSQTSKVNLLQSDYENDNSKSSRYNLRNFAVTEKESRSKKKTKGKKLPSTYSEKLASPLCLTPKTFNSASGASHGVSKRKKNVLDIDVSQHPQISLSKSNDENGISKSSRYNLRLRNQHVSKRASGNGLSSNSSFILKDITKTPKCLLETNSKNAKRSSRCTLLKKRESSVNKSPFQTCMTLQSQSSTKKQKLAKNVNQTKTSRSCRKPQSSSKKQMTSKRSNAFQFKHFNLTDGIPLDDLSTKKVDKRKAKSEGCRLSGRNALKRKKYALEALQKADDEDHEDDLYESKSFDHFKDLFQESSDSERSYSIATPSLPFTPIVRHKTPKFKWFFSSKQYAISRKIALDYMYRNRNRKNKNRKKKNTPKTPVAPEKKKLEFSEALEDALKLKNTIESLNEEGSDNDSYFSFC